MKSCRILEWDSNFFGFKVAQILPSTLSRNELENILIFLKNQDVTLSYWASNPEDDESQNAASFFSGFLADKKVTYIIDLQDHAAISSTDASIISIYTGPTVNAELDHLAVEAGLYSRFKVDPMMPADKFEELYKLWIRNSIDLKLADAVFVARDVDKIVGMVTVGEKKGRGDIGLIAVDTEVRGKKIGTSLVSAAKKWAFDKGYRHAQVVTQGSNKSACQLYEKNGYKVEMVENVYHFWSK